MMSVPDYVTEAVSVLRSSYPNGLPRHDYMPLLFIFGDILTERSLSLIFELCGFADAQQAGSDLVAARLNFRERPEVERIIKITELLSMNGYHKWLAKMEKFDL